MVDSNYSFYMVNHLKDLMKKFFLPFFRSIRGGVVLDTIESFELGRIPQNFKIWDYDPK
jgi:hypothetical protein